MIHIGVQTGSGWTRAGILTDIFQAMKILNNGGGKVVFRFYRLERDSWGSRFDFSLLLFGFKTGTPAFLSIILYENGEWDWDFLGLHTLYKWIKNKRRANGSRK